MGTGENQKNEFVLNPAVYDLDGKYFHRGNEDIFLLMLNGMVSYYCKAQLCCLYAR